MSTATTERVDGAAEAGGVERVGVVGAGTMGAGIGELCARAGHDVRLAVRSQDSAAAGLRRITTSLDRALAKGKIDEDARDSALARITFTTDLADLADRQLVVESVAEEETVKHEIFSTLDKVVEDPEAILATNTSSLSVARLARVTGRPGQVLGIHFFNPVPVLPLVELVGSVLTDGRAVRRAEAFVTDGLGKHVIHTPDRAGFVVNALLFPYLLSAIRMVDTGTATADVVDSGMELGCSHPLGPLKLADLIGLDTTVAIARAMYEETKEPLFAPPPLLLRMVECGLLGKKSGRGFYTYR
ncbi:3-hydroxybutyryl-CoA dehydrogenase [Streptomyces sp. NPDC102360]|uniref:3-hydroxybutyryl-CoA dehydrogenase n=1 Tax=Streptomyces sp. NPDC102360 TaxID=3366160 RepID=UPI0038261792